jgi:hypothetical protein
MNFTFGIVTDGDNDDNIDIIISSIENLKIPHYEIIIVGNSNINKKNCKVIRFNENIKNKWITRKKNIITENANFENIVYSHDYIRYDENWYSEFLKFGEDFKICTNKILNKDGNRFRDWTLWPDSLTDEFNFLNSREYIIPYEIKHLSKYMYISGSYWIAKKQIMNEFSLNENLIWGESEDVEWSNRVKQKYNFSINEYSIVHFLKNKKVSFVEVQNEEKINLLKKIK